MSVLSARLSTLNLSAIGPIGGGPEAIQRGDGSVFQILQRHEEPNAAFARAMLLNAELGSFPSHVRVIRSFIRSLSSNPDSDLHVNASQLIRLALKLSSRLARDAFASRYVESGYAESREEALVAIFENPLSENFQNTLSSITRSPAANPDGAE